MNKLSPKMSDRYLVAKADEFMRKWGIKEAIGIADDLVALIKALTVEDEPKCPECGYELKKLHNRENKHPHRRKNEHSSHSSKRKFNTVATKERYKIRGQADDSVDY